MTGHFWLKGTREVPKGGGRARPLTMRERWGRAWALLIDANWPTPSSFFAMELADLEVIEVEIVNPTPIVLAAMERCVAAVCASAGYTASSVPC